MNLVSSPERTHSPPALYRLNAIRDRVASSIGITEERKVGLYIELEQSATMLDGSYWLQALFSAGIATLGLVLNSPAVIIGAMLISPLMGPILACGLALAAGDLVLGVRGLAKLLLSCALAIGFALLLVGVLPFKAVTGEILSRTHPNTLDLAVALFSGAIGSLATCKDVKGIATSIPGVAIAVALMPPLCVVGYGLGVAVSLDPTEGRQVAMGGGLLFFTNLVAITFTAMIVYLILHIDTDAVRKRVTAWKNDDPESRFVQRRIDALPTLQKLQRIGTLPGRLLSVTVIILITLVPLSRSFSQLKSEILSQQQDARLRQVVQTVWQSSFARMPDGSQRSYLGALNVSDDAGKTNLQLTVFTSKPYTDTESGDFKNLIAQKLGEPVDSMSIQLVQIPTTTANLLRRSAESPKIEEPPTVARIQEQLVTRTAEELRGLRLPEPAQLVTYSLFTGPGEPLGIRIVYLSDHDVSSDALELIVEDIRQRVAIADARVVLVRVNATLEPLVFARNSAVVTPAIAATLDIAGQSISEYPMLRGTVTGGGEPGEHAGIADERTEAIVSYLVEKWHVPGDVVTRSATDQPPRTTTLTISVAVFGKS